MHAKSSRGVSFLTALALVAGVVQFANAQGVGNLGSLPGPTIPMNNPGGWDIGGASGPVLVQRDPNGPKWLKHFSDPLGGPITAVPGQTFNVHELLMIDQPLPWSDWHEDILTPGWEWTNTISFLANFAPTPGLAIVNSPGTLTQGGSLSFTFNSLPPGTLIDIRKELIYMGQPGVIFTGSIDVEQYPTPEPASLGLIAAGGLVALRRRRRTRLTPS